MSLVNKWQSRKSQIFIFDFITSFIILIVAIVIVLSYFQSTSDNVDIYGINLEIIDSFTTTNINSLNNEEVRNLFIAREITNIENTIAQQVGEFYYRNSFRPQNSTIGISVIAFLIRWQLTKKSILHFHQFFRSYYFSEIEGPYCTSET